MIIERANTEYSTYRIPVLVMTTRGSLLACFECRKDYSDWAEIDLKIIESMDGGETWRTLQVIKGNRNTLNNPVFIVKENTVHFLYCENYKRVFYCKSTDDGKSFSVPRDISETFEKSGFQYTVVAVGPSHGIVHNGNLLCPVWFAYNEENPKKHSPSFIATVYSKDDGETWSVGEQIGKDTFVNPSECSLAVDKDNRVRISVRNKNGDLFHNFRGFGISDNGYSNWEQVQVSDNMPDWICQGAMFSDNDKLYHSNCVGEERTELTLKISDDGFETYESILIDEVGGYSDLTVNGGIAYILYERNPCGDGLYFKKLRCGRD
jgi:sialidase-1